MKQKQCAEERGVIVHSGMEYMTCCSIVQWGTPIPFCLLKGNYDFCLIACYIVKL